jgi:peroxiredoxin
MPRPQKGMKPGTFIPNFKLEDTNGRKYAAEQFLRRPFLLYFLRGTW